MDPAGGPDQPSKSVLLEVRVVINAGEDSGMQRLHQKRTNAGNKCGHSAMDSPDGGTGAVEPRVLSLGQLFRPFGWGIGAAAQGPPDLRLQFPGEVPHVPFLRVRQE
jgi:hypothetical protein